MWAMRSQGITILAVIASACVVKACQASAQPPSCPPAGASLRVSVDNPTATSAGALLTGTLLTASCAGGATTYSQTVSCAAGRSDCLAAVTGLASGVWKHQISVGAQNQYTKSIIVAADPAGAANTIAWVVFKTVLTVDSTDDVSSTLTPQCPSAPATHACTLRAAMSAGATADPPLLVQFDPGVFPPGTPTSVRLTDAATLPIAGYRMVVDGTDPNGDPTFRGDPFNRVVVLPSGGATIVVSNELASLRGLFVQRPTLADGATPKDVILFDGASAQQNLVVNCKVDGGGGALTSKSAAHDCIEGLNGAGLNWAGANVVQNSEVTACPDKGIKATTLAYLTVHDSWVHHNIGGGIQATLSGNIEADRNVVEYNGYNATSQVFFDANGLAANGADANTPSIPSVLHTHGNIIRLNSARGISVQELSTAVITSDLSCGARNAGTGGQNGIAIFNSTGSPASATVRGTAVVYNPRNGVTIANESTADCGQSGSDAGNNAFTRNATKRSLGGHNFDNSGTQSNLPATGNQWQRCYAHSNRPGTICDGKVSMDVSGVVAVTPPQPHRADAAALPVRITGFFPTKAKAGDLVHVTGSGFNAIDGYAVGGNCFTSIQRQNKCSPRVAGTCVEYEASPEIWTPLLVQSVTPTEIVVQLPRDITCSQAVTVRVRRIDHKGAMVMGTGTFCTNS